MTRALSNRLRSPKGDAGAFAILYAVLVVVLLGMSAIVVDFANVRQDRRIGRSATDSAAIAGALMLAPQRVGGISPYDGCQAAWDYLTTTLRLSSNPGRSATACSPFLPANLTGGSPQAYCAQATPAEIDATWPPSGTIGGRTFQIAWPIPKTGGSGYLKPDIAPGSVSQTFDDLATSGRDGTVAGCDRLGVAIFQAATFALGSGIGSRGTNTQVHSVARVNPSGGPNDTVAALNVLNPHECEAIVTTGGGQVLVGPVLTNGVVTGPGTIAVESDGLNPANGNVNSTCNGGKYIIDPTTGQGSLICASDTILVNAASCDGAGIIESHALDAGAVYAKACNTVATACNNVTPAALVGEGSTHGYDPVTKHNGCNTTRLPCTPPATNYVALLESAYGGAGVPASVYNGSKPPYTNPYTSAFVTVPNTVCNGNASVNISSIVILAPGNWYAPCAINIKNGGTLIAQGGNLVVNGNGGIAVASGGCLVVNTLVSTCPTTVTGSGAGATTNVPPTSDEIVFLRGGGLDNAGSLVMPQTFVYSMGASGGVLHANGTTLTLWTAPGAGAVNGSGRTTLEQACYDAAASPPAVNQDCMDSRFAKLAYWSDYAAVSTGSPGPNNFNGQGNLNVVGVFFTPKAYFNFTGGGSYAAASAQFWADELDINGGAIVGLSPDSRFAFTSPSPLVLLIR